MEPAADNEAVRRGDPAGDWAGLAARALALPGYLHLAPTELTAALAACEPAALLEWDQFAASWERLARDTHMGDGGRYRFRRHGVYAAAPAGPVRRQPPAPHYQSLNYNALNGGIERWFEPLEPAIADGALLRGLCALCLMALRARHPEANWHIEVHQFRIVAEVGQAGNPTPEGVHRDGVDYVLVMMVRRENIASGRTDLYDDDGRPVSSFTLVEPRAAVLLDDRRLAHGVTPVVPVDERQPSYRDVLVITFRVDSR